MRRLVYLAYNLRWTWEPRVAELFSALSPQTWQASRNPVAVLSELISTDLAPLGIHWSAVDTCAEELAEYLSLHRFGELVDVPRIAYLSAEFGVASCLPLYAGGLGVLAGDHLKAASDLALPVIGIGLMYRYGFCRQELDASGYQREQYDKSDPSQLPVRPVLLNERLPLRIAVPFPGRRVYMRAWRADVGRVPLYLLDTDLDENREEDRWITAHLYGGDHDTRLRQEMVLGIGGVRLLRALCAAGLERAVAGYHLNEGHSAMMVLELARERLQDGLAPTFDDALVQVASHVAFTTHTPVSAGHDSFAPSLVETYLADYRAELGLSHQEFMRYGRLHPDLDCEPFNMTVLALRGAARRNGVSHLHASVSRKMWRGVGLGSHDVAPLVAMDAITNGVHAPTWVGQEMAALFDECPGCIWRRTPQLPTAWARFESVPRDRLWRARLAQRARLLRHALVDSNAERTLVVGFARRFAAYKRAGLLLADPERLAGLLTGDPECPVVILFAGKAHPQDAPGKALVQRIVEASRDERFRGRIVFLVDYDFDLARLLVQGADLWLNTPRRPQEASGTSGMKAAINGALQLSELDGWWDESYRPDLGWALGAGLPEDLPDDERDAAEARQLFDLLDQQISGLFWSRDAAGLPSQWLDRVVRSIVSLAPYCSAQRMVADYASRFYYTPAASENGPRQRPISDITRIFSSGLGTHPSIARG